MKNTKTTIRELSARYRDILKKCFYLNAVALGLFAATSASAAVNVVTGVTFNQGTSDATLTPAITDIEGSVITAISNNITNTVYSDGKYNASNASYRADGKSSLSVTDGAPAPDDYQFTLGDSTRSLDGAGDGTNMYKSLIGVDGYTALSSATNGTLGGSANYATAEIARDNAELYTQTAGSYKFQMGATANDDPTAADAAGSYKFASAKALGDVTLAAAGYSMSEAGGELMDATANLAYTGYSWTDWSGASVALNGDGLDPFSYTFTNSNGDPDSLGNYIQGTDLVLPTSEFDNAAVAVGHYNTDKANYTAEKGVWSGDNTNYQAAVAKYNTERAAFNALVDAYDNAETGYAAGYAAATTAYNTANTDYQAADAAYDADATLYGTTNTAYAAYNGSVQQAVDKRADAAITRGLEEGGAIRTAVTTGITTLITTKEGLLSQDIGYNLADPDNETTGLVARLEALTDESTDKTLVGAINANTGAIATLDSTKVNNAGNFTADTDSALIKGKTVVAAIQDTAAQVDTNTTAIGTLTSLTTDEKSNLVGAVNELNSTKVNNAGNFTAETDSALIKNKTVVAAIQSTASKVDAIDAAVGDISQLDTTKNMQGLTTVDTVHALNKLDDVIYTKVGDGAVTASSYTSGTKTLTQHVSAIGSALDASVGTTTAIAGIHGSYTAQATAPSSGSGSATAAPTLAAEVQAINDALENTLGTTAQLSALWGGGAGGADAPTNLAGYLNQQAGNAAATQAANEAQFAQLDSKIQKLETKMEKGLAANNALAGLVPLDHVHRTQVSAALGGYKDNQALAVGAFHYLNDRTLLNAGAAYGGNDSISYKVGVTFGF